MMFLYNTEKRASAISGEGLYALERIPKGAVIALFPYEEGMLTEDEYQEEQRKGNEVIIMSAVGWVGKYFLTNDDIGNEEYINHSGDPNMLYHCGICFAKRDIEPGEELTADYKYFLAGTDVNRFTDSRTKETIDGIDTTSALVESARESIGLFS